MERTEDEWISLRFKIRKLFEERKYQWGRARKRDIIDILCLNEEDYKKALHYKIPWAKFEDKVNEFKSRNGNLPKQDYNYKDVMEHFGPNPICYLTGAKLDYYDYCSLDHIIPASIGGDNELSNMGLTSCLANYEKGVYLAEDFIKYKIKQSIGFLKFHGYKVEKEDYS